MSHSEYPITIDELMKFVPCTEEPPSNVDQMVKNFSKNPESVSAVKHPKHGWFVVQLNKGGMKIVAWSK